MNRIDDIIKLIARRDNISILEATNIVEECLDDIHYVVSRGDYMAAEDILASYLALEPDYLEIIINEIY